MDNSNGNISLVEPIILFLIIFLWTPSHFWALSLYKSDDYKKAKDTNAASYSWSKNNKNKYISLLIAMLPVVIAPYAFNFAGIFYLATTIAMTLIL